jgi:hypothetical protein
MNRVMHFPSLETLYASSSALYNQASSQLNRISTVATDCLRTASAWTFRSVETARGYFSQINVSRLSAMSHTARAYLSSSFHTVHSSLGEGTARVYSCISHLPAQGSEALGRLSAISSRATHYVCKSSEFLGSHKVALLCAAGLGVAVWGWARQKQIPSPPVSRSSQKQATQTVPRPVPSDPMNAQCTLERVNAVVHLVLKAPPVEEQEPPAELLFCVDVSGSMDGRRIEAAKAAFLSILSEAEEQITKNTDRPISLGIVEFNHQAKWTVDKVSLGKDLIAQLKTRVSNRTLFTCSGSTATLLGLRTALKGLPSPDLGVRPAHGLVLLTDGDDSLSPEGVAAVQTRLAQAGTDFLVIQIKDRPSAPDSLKSSLCEDKRSPSPNNLPLRVEYVSLDGSQSGDLSPIAAKISQLFGRQLNPMLAINAVTASAPWHVEPLQLPLYVAPNQDGFCKITVTCRGLSAPSSVSLSVHYMSYNGRPGTFQKDIPINNPIS